MKLRRTHPTDRLWWVYLVLIGLSFLIAFVLERRLHQYTDMPRIRAEEAVGLVGLTGVGCIFGYRFGRRIRLFIETVIHVVRVWKHIEKEQKK